MIQTQLRNLLTGNGYEAEIINDFPVAMEQMRSVQPHLILLDIKLPGSDGFLVCSQIRIFSNVPIIFVTSCSTDMDELNKYHAWRGCFYYKAIQHSNFAGKNSIFTKKGISCDGTGGIILQWGYPAFRKQ